MVASGVRISSEGETVANHLEQNKKITLADLKETMNLTVIVAALGYFVDLFDITLFGILRVASLKDLGYTNPADILTHGLSIYNWGMVGMMVGGLLWGVLADKFGRLSVLFGSIILYSLGTIANAFVWDAQSYAICRFITSIGLAGELGAAITLVSESLPTRLRGIGTTFVAGVGLSGAVAAALVGGYFSWKTTYIIGGCMGLALLVMRFKMRESAMFSLQAPSTVKRGNLLLLAKPERIFRYLRCIMVGMPIYFITGILFTFSPELTKGLVIDGTVSAGTAILCGTIGLSLGDFLSGILSHLLKSRKKAIGFSLTLAFVSMLYYLLNNSFSADMIYVICFALGLAAGYWAVLVTVAAEQFGTNIRATVATSVPNFVRGSAVLATLGFAYLKSYMTLSQAALAVGLVCFGLAFIALFLMEETFSKDLDFVEVDFTKKVEKPTPAQKIVRDVMNPDMKPVLRTTMAAPDYTRARTKTSRQPETQTETQL